ncbi:DegT/DnrJ/EryC1/StrS family aminotransferase [Roseobacter sp. HKCCA0434]|uniref:DegT/DnrJ/EryC1/StrS aminotransferase family protein n=1 Tax=Roseobacter sp. HKCCA0434 TaxID=3079297 RepID=UPI002905B68D|nr:DegT/DnrJ/EryC1/StrS family aminotransferase [Roseobacter sp. HKCCA0434]
MSSSNIFVTRPSLPPLAEFVPYLERIWDSGILTNGGQMHRELETALAAHLRVPQISLFGNGTIALVAALKVLELEGEVITTPFSFVATTHALKWNGLEPAFADIDPVTLNIDPARIEERITERTSAILAVHCYGNPCDVDAIEAIARRHGLKVIYDAAHAFGVDCHCGSVLTHGDLSVLSFHATKVFSTLEGGAIVAPDAEMKGRIDRSKNFGIVSETEVESVGINGKMNEVQAAFGLLQLRRIDAAIAARARVAARYDAGLAGIAGIEPVPSSGQIRANHAYYPVRVRPSFPVDRDTLYEALKARGIFSRRYFYPLISDLPMYRDLPSADPAGLPAARAAGAEVLCLPIYPDLSEAEQDRVIEAITEVGR